MEATEIFFVILSKDKDTIGAIGAKLCEFGTFGKAHGRVVEGVTIDPETCRYQIGENSYPARVIIPLPGFKGELLFALGELAGDGMIQLISASERKRQ